MNQQIDLPLLERWLGAWSQSRGLPLPRHAGGGLVVDVGWPDQLRRHLFLDAGPALQACAATIDAPHIFIKAAVDPATLRAALPERWTIGSARYLMQRTAPMTGSHALPGGYARRIDSEHGAAVLRFLDAQGQVAALGRLVVNGGTAVFDRIETHEDHRRKGLGRALMGALDILALQAGANERLLVATEAGRALYASLGWSQLAPYSTAVLATPALARQPRQDSAA
ncbi:MAG: GNAT family N-acetyltransferase [Pseudomonadota bacterium]